MHKVTIDYKKFLFYDTLCSLAYKGIVSDFNRDCYSLKDINFNKGDIVLDVGWNIGIFSIFLAKKYPFLKIYSFEPCKNNYISFKKNIRANNIDDGIITVFNKAVTMDGRDVTINFDYLNSGGSKIKKFNKSNSNSKIVSSMTLNEIIAMVLKENNQTKIKLLKMDCEFSEYEILYNTKVENLKKIDCFRGEFHENGSLKYNAEELKKYISCYIKNIKVEINKNC